MEANKIIIRPLLTEKSYAGIASKVYTFVVAKNAGKIAGLDVLRVINDQIGTPTYTPDLVRLLADLIESEQYGVYNASNEGGYISWYDFACEIFRQARIEVTVLPVSTAEYGQSKALRPLNSRLDKSKLRQCGFTPLPDWRDALTRYLGTLS